MIIFIASLILASNEVETLYLAACRTRFLCFEYACELCERRLNVHNVFAEMKSSRAYDEHIGRKNKYIYTHTQPGESARLIEIHHKHT